jgi:plasmid stabilization system protein ParE
MKRRLAVRPEAQLDAEEAAFWYDSQQPDLGDQFIQELDELLTRVTESPHQFPELGFGARRGLMHRFPYAVYFLVDKDSSIVVAVLHQSRNPNTWKLRLT